MTSTTTRDARGRFATVGTATAEDVAHRPGTIVLGADGIRRTVRGARFGASTVTLLYVAGPSDTYRRGYVLSVVGPFRPYGTTRDESPALVVNALNYSGEDDGYHTL